MQKLMRALHVAHLQRLSVDLLESTQLQHIFDAVTRKAHHYQLMLHHLSDLFQIETSYLHNRQDLQLILHILMAPADLNLCLLQLHKFPLPFTNMHFLMPDRANQILAISSGVDRLSVNLMGCHCINSLQQRAQLHLGSIL
jgi:hypothetical protein